MFATQEPTISGQRPEEDCNHASYVKNNTDNSSSTGIQWPFDEPQDDWTPVSRPKRGALTRTTCRKSKSLNRAPAIEWDALDVEDGYDCDLPQCSQVGNGGKDVRRDSYYKHRHGRYNRKEERKVQWKRRQERLKVIQSNAEFFESVTLKPKAVNMGSLDPHAREWSDEVYIESQLRGYEDESPFFHTDTEPFERISHLPPRELEARRNEIENEILRARVLEKAEAEQANWSPPPPEIQETVQAVTKELKTAATAMAVPESLTRTIVRQLENIVFFSYHLYQARSIPDIVVAALHFVKDLSNKSITDFISDFCIPTKDLEPQGLQMPDIVRLAVHNPMYRKIGTLITASLAAAGCAVTGNEFSMGRFQMISLPATQKFYSVPDLLSTLLETFKWMIDVGCEVIRTGTLEPLIHSDMDVARFDSTYRKLIIQADSVLSGNDKTMSPQDLEGTINKMLQLTAKLSLSTNDKVVKSILDKKASTLVMWREKCRARMRNTAYRKAPVGYSLTGPTSVGKSFLCNLVMATSLNAIHGEYDRTKVMTKDMFDKYDSTLTSDIQGVILDDVGNGKAQFAQAGVSDVIIKMINNVAAPAVKADIADKGNVYMLFDTCVATSNLPDLDACTYSNCPESILRRFLHIRVKVRREYQKSTGTSLDTSHPEVRQSLVEKWRVPDFWAFDVEEVSVLPIGQEKYKWLFVPYFHRFQTGPPMLCSGISLHDLLRMVADHSKAHHEKQTHLIEELNNTDFVFGKDGVPLNKPESKPETGASDDEVSESVSDDDVSESESDVDATDEDPPLDPHGFIEDMVDVGVKSVTRQALHYINPFWWATRNPIVRHYVKKEYGELMRESTESLILEGYSRMPVWFTHSDFMKRFASIWQSHAAARDAWKYFKYVTIGIYAPLFLQCWLSVERAESGKDDVIGRRLVPYRFRLCSPMEGLRNMTWQAMLVPIITPIHCLGATFAWYRRKKEMERQFESRPQALEEAFEEVRRERLDSRPNQAIAISALLGCILAGTAIYKRVNSFSCNGLSVEEIDSPKQHWLGAWFSKLRIDGERTPNTSSADQIVNALTRNNLFRATISFPEGRKVSVNCFFLRKNVALLPRHIFHAGLDINNPCSEWATIEFRRGSGESGSCFVSRVDTSTMFLIKGKDCYAVFIPNCPDLKNRVSWLPKSYPTGDGMCTLVSKNRDADTVVDTVHATFADSVGTTQITQRGSTYRTRLAVGGSCMSPLVSRDKSPVIVGFHIAGKELTRHGASMTLLQSEADAAIAHFECRNCLSADVGEIPSEIMGCQVRTSLEPHARSVFAHVREHDVVTVLGSTQLRAQQRSCVQPSPISASVEKHCGVSQQWGPPKMRPNWKCFNATLVHILNPSSCWVPRELERARRDYFSGLERYIPTLRKLTMSEILDGSPTQRFIDAMPMNTSRGFPLRGPKTKSISVEYNGSARVSTPDEVLLRELQRLEDTWKDGKRAYPVFLASLKDEPTELTKDKVRVFQAINVAMGMAIRKYWLPLARFIHLHPLESECAVGINCMSDQWQTFIDHVQGFNSHSGLAYDYSKFDVRMSSQVTHAAWHVLLDIAQKANYPEDDLYIMRMMINDIVHPVMDWNGTLCMFTGINTSGHNLTVVINSIVNSLYMRMGFFHVYPSATSFQECVRLGTYGDDGVGSVRTEYNDFNFETFQSFLADHDIKITEPSKTDDKHMFLPWSEIDFLKRKSSIVEGLPYTVGKLDENSIFKSLHCNMRSDAVDSITVSCSCITTAMHEFFAHGRTIYEARRKELQHVAEDFSLTIPALELTFEEKLATFKSE